MTTLHPIQRLAFLAIAGLGALVALSTLPGLWITLRGHQPWDIGPQPLVAGFEAITFLAGLVALWMGLRYRPDGFGLGILCAAGALFVGAFLGVKMLQSAGDQVPSLKQYLIIRASLALGLTAMAGLVKVGPRQDCWRALVVGSALLAPLASILYLVVRNQTHLVTDRVARLGEITQIVVWLLLTIAVGILTIWGGHLIIRAFELTREPKPGDANP